ncbi:Hypothetical protein CINCED_3A010859 [Cinara cedri]|uniref:Uncharacterized protein n=1 Tax=Cinara cedri TaxID=506608 RepID=A0A5E4NC97_9HEMI|nr:Hypothetical protein CINCED_3A010859 [Cinara cedri]
MLVINIIIRSKNGVELVSIEEDDEQNYMENKTYFHNTEKTSKNRYCVLRCFVTQAGCKRCFSILKLVCKEAFEKINVPKETVFLLSRILMIISKNDLFKVPTKAKVQQKKVSCNFLIGGKFLREMYKIRSESKKQIKANMKFN